MSFKQPSKTPSGSYKCILEVTGYDRVFHDIANTPDSKSIDRNRIIQESDTKKNGNIKYNLDFKARKWRLCHVNYLVRYPIRASILKNKSHLLLNLINNQWNLPVPKDHGLGSSRFVIVTEMFVPIHNYFHVLSRFVYISCKYLLRGCPVRRCASYPSSHISPFIITWYSVLLSFHKAGLKWQIWVQPSMLPNVWLSLLPPLSGEPSFALKQDEGLLIIIFGHEFGKSPERYTLSVYCLSLVVVTLTSTFVSPVGLIHETLLPKYFSRMFFSNPSLFCWVVDHGILKKDKGNFQFVCTSLKRGTLAKFKASECREQVFPNRFALASVFASHFSFPRNWSMRKWLLRDSGR